MVEGRLIIEGRGAQPQVVVPCIVREGHDGCPVVAQTALVPPTLDMLAPIGVGLK